MARKRKEETPEAPVEVAEAATAEPTDGGAEAPASATTPPAGAGAEIVPVEPAAPSGQTAEMSSADRERIAGSRDGEPAGDDGGSGAAEKASEVRDQAAEKAQQVRETVSDKAQQVRATVSGQAQGAAGTAQAAPAKADDAFNERPELFVLGALAGGFVLAKLIGALGDDDE